MASVNSVGTPSTVNSTSEISQQATLGKDEFLKMLVAQLQNQDPLNPMDGTDFTAQLAQFSSLEQLTNMNTNFETFTSNQMMTNQVQSVSLLGKEVQASGDVLHVDGSSVDICYSLAEAATEGEVSIYSASGALVETIPLGSQTAGTNSITWDSSGVAHGDYTFEVSAANQSGGAVEIDTFIKGLVTGLNFQNGRSTVMIGEWEVPFEDVVSVEDGNNEINNM
jgi:flagellar basal-body rod modification protein FlgD